MTTLAAPPFRASRYTTGAILLHWTIALLVLVQIGGGWAMMHLLEEGTALQYDLYQLHKSVGIAILVLTVSRILWRAFNPPPPEPASVSRVERWAAHLVHYLFYVLMLAVPLTGWLVITVSPVQIETVLFFVERLPWPHLPGFEAMSQSARTELAEGAEWVHAVLAYTMGGLVALHVAGALKHHIQDGHYIARMSPSAAGDGPRNSYGHATTWLATVIFFGAMVGAATWARMEPPAVAEVPATVSPDAAAVLGAGATDAAAAPAAPDASDGLAPLWTVDLSASRVGFAFAFSGRPVEGTFAGFEPTIRFSPDDLAGSSIEVAIDTGSATAGPGITAAQLTGPDGFAVAQFPTAVFRADTIRTEGDGYAAEGMLTIRDQSMPVTLPFGVTIDGDTARASGSVTVDRAAFGIGVSNDPAGTTLGKDVTISVDILATRAGEAPAAAGAAPAERATWTVAQEASSVGFGFGFQGSRVTGAIRSFTSDIRFDPENLAEASIDVSLDLSSASVEGRAVTETQLRGPDGLAVAEDPVARFRSDDVTRTGEGSYLAKGELTLRGVTVPVELPFTLDIVDGRAVADGTVTVDRLAFGIGEENDPIGRWIAPTVEIAIHVVAFAPGVTPTVLR